ncbi:VOC family protein [Aestuariirhabdus sp. Z084]|uniref:VOC family protein n=1 Tax=Aestuariirhabdus haliotis TaxID=2918751 RepID=UPI00201B44AB|nr:VOC family protein [Aestuariirhabdus haliotis]MCL6417646.1 VOC family protein [Aestuariirhabdus haliotis]MCL6421572.1 VOC family protein [Aestuariirhabdus haliotis]
MSLTPFHIAVPVRDLNEARAFYGDLLGFPEGRSDSHWIDYSMYGHQFVVHLNEALGANGKVTLCHNDVDGHGVPVPHCGVVLEMPQWQALAQRLRDANVEFVIEPYIRFAGQPGEQATMFFMDPSGNALEFKAFADIENQLFAS